MWKDKRLLEVLGIEHPIIQAPMAGASTPEMAAASANSGCLGSLGCAMMSADAFAETFAKTRSLTNGALNMNFFCHEAPKTDQQKIATITDHLEKYYSELSITDLPKAEPTHYPFGGAVADTVIDAAPQVISFHFGLPDQSFVDALKHKGSKILCSATTPAEAINLQSRGVDVIIAQGWEAGGHHGFYLKDKTASMGTMALVPAIVDVVDVPVVAAGGIADGRGIAAALALGASGVQIGTAFLTCEESAIPKAHKASLMASDGSNTTITKVFSGRPARGIENRYTDETIPLEEDLPGFPIMNTLTGPLRKASAASDKPDFIAQWSGQAVSLNREMTTQTLISRMIEETQSVLKAL